MDTQKIIIYKLEKFLCFVLKVHSNVSAQKAIWSARQYRRLHGSGEQDDLSPDPLPTH